MNGKPHRYIMDTLDQNCTTISLWTEASILPIGMTDTGSFLPMVADELIAILLSKYPVSAALPLTEQAAVNYLQQFDNDFISDLDDLAYLTHLPIHTFCNIGDWVRLINLYKIHDSEASVVRSFIKTDDEQHLSSDFLMNYGSVVSFMQSNYFELASVPSRYSGFITHQEVGRTIIFSNDMCIKHDAINGIYSVGYDPASLLIQCGDIELNPGPIMSKLAEPHERLHQQRVLIRSLEKELAAIKKRQERQDNHIQRQLELEKRDRKKKRKAGSETKRYAQGLVSFSNNLGTAAESLATGVGPTLDMAQHALQTLIATGESLKKVFHVPEGVDLIGVLLSLLSISRAILDKQIFTVSLHAIQLARHLGVSLSSIMSLLPHVSEETESEAGDQNIYYGTEPDALDDYMRTAFPIPSRAPVAQSLVQDLFKTAKTQTQLLPVAAFLSFFCGIFNLMVTGNVPGPAAMVKHFTSVGRAASGFKAIKDMFAWITDYLQEIYYETVYGVSKEEYQFMKNYPQLENIYAASKIVEKLTRTVIDASKEISEQILSMNFQLADYAYQASRMGSRTNVALVTSLQKRIKDQVDWATHSPARCQVIREEPVSCYLFGEPGVGKSVMTAVLKAHIYKKYLAERGLKFETCSYPRHARNEYWEGYTGQPIVELDDFGNKKDSVNSPAEEFEELEYMVNTAQYPLKMAEIKSKGATNFTSEFILASSNALCPDVVSLTDPGAVYRRFHIWAEVTIDPRYGKEVGITKRGRPYYGYDKQAAAAHLNVSEEDLDPLMVEHYRLNVYKVTNNAQTKQPVITWVRGKQGITFDQFWNYFQQVNDKRKTNSQALANAIREVAGLETPAPAASEREILDSLDRIFRPEKFLKAVAECDDIEYDIFEEDEIFGNLFEEASEAVDEEIFGEAVSFGLFRRKLTALKVFIDKSKRDFRKGIKRGYASLEKVASVLARPFLATAEFILSFLKCTTSRLICTFSDSTYLPELPTPQALLGMCSIFAALAAGVWFSGIFNRPHDWCQFSTNPVTGNMPCHNCKPCKIMAYPPRGDMIDHYLARVAVPQVRKELNSIGISPDTIAEHTLGLWRRKYENAQGLAGLTAQRIYEHQPAVAKHQNYAQAIFGKCEILSRASAGWTAQTYPEAFNIIANFCHFNCDFCSTHRNSIAVDFSATEEGRASCIRGANEILALARPYAQKVYDPQPHVAKHTSFAQGYVDLKTECEIGSVRYAQRDRVRIEQTTQVLLNNSVWINAVDTQGRACRSNGTFIVGRTLITTAHTVLNPPSSEPFQSIILRNPYSTQAAITVPYSDCQITQLKQLDGTLVDLAFISLPPVVPSRPRILSKFLAATDIGYLDEGSMVFSGFHESNGRTIVQEKHPASFVVSTKATEYLLHAPGTCPKADPCICPIHIGNHVEYDLETLPGMCGGLLSVQNKMVHSKLIGFHVAGGVGCDALGVLVTRELLEQNLDAHVAAHNVSRQYLIDGRIPYSQNWVDPRVQAELLDVGDCLSIGVAKSPAAPVQTTLTPSLIHDKVQKHTTIPAFLKPTTIGGVVVDPMIKGIKKVMGGQVYIDKNLLNAAANDVFNGLGGPDGGIGKIHSYKESIVGVEGDPYKRPVNRTTSPGYPWNLDNTSKGKTAWLGDEEEYIIDNKELLASVVKLIEDARDGVRGDALSIATLKDEKRPIAKVMEGKTRVFEACPQQLVLAMRQYFMDFSAHIMRKRIDNGICVGINPYSLEWTKLANHLLAKGDAMIAGDFSNFDGSLTMQVLVKIVEKINEWYNDGEENALIRAALWEHICNADVLVRGEVIRQTHSQPSGNSLTVIINSLFNAIIMRVAYLRLKQKNGMAPICDYRKYVAEAIYGDDDVKSVALPIRSWFNQLTLTDALAEIGLTYTDEAKTGKILPFKSLKDTRFLKRGWELQLDGTYMAPMEISNVLEISNWVRGKAVRSATIENCGCSLMELALHPQDVYEYWGARIRDECAKVGITFHVPTWWEQREEYLYNRDAYAKVEYVPLW